jgi:hypothetical protein
MFIVIGYMYVIKSHTSLTIFFIGKPLINLLIIEFGIGIRNIFEGET